MLRTPRCLENRYTHGGKAVSFVHLPPYHFLETLFVGSWCVYLLDTVAVTAFSNSGDFRYFLNFRVMFMIWNSLCVHWKEHDLFGLLPTVARIRHFGKKISKILNYSLLLLMYCLTYFSNLRMEAACFTETSVCLQALQCCNQQSHTHKSVINFRNVTKLHVELLWEGYRFCVGRWSVVQFMRCGWPGRIAICDCQAWSLPLIRSVAYSPSLYSERYTTVYLLSTSPANIAPLTWLTGRLNYCQPTPLIPFTPTHISPQAGNWSLGTINIQRRTTCGEVIAKLTITT